ncbi:MAG: VOC family protein [Acidibacillus sp.]|nr:VOC family protein [Acidibacillus sp.]
MIKGLYEVHLPVSNISASVEFYQKLGLQLKEEDDEVAFLWIIPQRSQLGLWKHEMTSQREPGSYPPNGRHLAFEVDFDDIEKAEAWLKERGISVAQHGKMPPIEPYARPHSRNASVYFNDPDGNNLEFICNLPDGPMDPARLIYLSEYRSL